MKRENVVSGVKRWTRWWVRERMDKLEETLSDTMSVNPFLMPFLFDFHNLKDFDDLAELIIAGHLITGHNTGFGKLMDEKVLPNVFGTTKLTKEYRSKNKPFKESCFDEIDHLVIRDDGTKELLCLKAGRWTIQLTMAVQLNAAFQKILADFSYVSDDIVVGVFYGTNKTLTDKYDILRGINRGAKHDVVDLTDRVFVYAGRPFWKWLSGGDDEAQEWVLEGITEALNEDSISKRTESQLAGYKRAVLDKYTKLVVPGKGLDWKKLLKEING